MEYEDAINTSVSGEQQNWAHHTFWLLRLAMRELRLLILINLARRTRHELAARGYLDVREGPFVCWCPCCEEAEATEFCQHSGCNVGYCQRCAVWRLTECLRFARRPFCTQHPCRCAVGLHVSHSKHHHKERLPEPKMKVMTTGDYPLGQWHSGPTSVMPNIRDLLLSGKLTC